MVSLKTKCSKCGKEMEPSEMRALPKGNGFICLNCYTNSMDPRVVSKERLRKPSESPTSPQSRIKSSSFFEQKEYVCDACGYKFKRSPEFIVKTCPFCGKPGYVHQKVDLPAQEFLNTQ